ncbi:MAG: acetyl-CoA carboxylase biotin carboxyl carrier protein subunit [Clostridiales bacterium]|jgi:biotin carboxyl carrier protein|nr:acetyl-CoA carboxylase biotin carboxyl carrier protein subunit [Clostridiales bacterium]
MKYQVTINNKTYEVEVERGEANLLATYEAVAPVASVAAAAPTPVAAASAPAAPHVQAVAGEALTAPMPGTIISVLKKVGDKVAEGEVVCILEAMKMENEVVAAIAGTVGQVLVAKGSVVKTGDPLVMIH